MKIFPAIDLFDGKAVRLYKGDYQNMTVYNDHPLEVAKDFVSNGATCLHLVDLQGAKEGDTPNFEVVKSIVENTSLFTEVGGGVRNLNVIEKYLSVGVDIKDGYVAIKGWTEKSAFSGIDFCAKMQDVGVKTIICTDVSRDGAMQGTNHQLYKTLTEKFTLDIIASGGVSSMDDIVRLKAQGVYGAIVGKAYYTGAIKLDQAIKVAL